jgi:hypothetical protein
MAEILTKEMSHERKKNLHLVDLLICAGFPSSTQGQTGCRRQFGHHGRTS